MPVFEEGDLQDFTITGVHNALIPCKAFGKKELDVGTLMYFACM